MCQLSYALLLSLFPIGLCAVAGEKPRVDYDPAFDFSALRTYDWRTHPEMEKNPELARKAIAGDIVMSEGNEILMGRRYQPDDLSPHFYITFFVKGQRYNEPTVLTTSWYYGPGPAWSTFSESVYREFVDGTLVIDIVDAKTNRLVWRASYHDQVTDWKNRHKIISKVVKDALAKFPPKKK